MQNSFYAQSKYNRAVLFDIIIIISYILWSHIGYCFATHIINNNNSPELLYLDLSVNNIKQSGIYAVVKIGSEIWLNSEQIKLLNLKDTHNLVEKLFFNQRFVLLPSWIITSVDMVELSLALTIPPEYMRVTVMSEAQKPVLVSPATYAFYWNYDLSLYHRPLAGQAQFMAAHKPVVATPYGSLSNQFMTRIEGINSIVRLETSYVLDFPRYQMRLTAGDFATDTPSFISPVAAAGLKISKGFMFQNASLSYPAMSFSGFSPRPADAEIWINDMLRLRKEVPMGGFVLDNIILPPGARDGTLVVKDAQGIVSSIPFSYYGDPELLRPGYTSYSYSLGFIRKDYGTRSFSYGEPAIFGSQKIGVNNYWTPSFHVQLSPKTFLFGLEQRFRLFDIGSTAIAAALSTRSFSTGFLISPQLQLDIRRAHFKARALISSADYLPVALPESKDKHAKISLTSGLNLDLPYVKHSSINYLLVANNKLREQTIGIRQQFPVYNNLIINLSADYNFSKKSFMFYLFSSYQVFDRHRVTFDAHNNLGNFQATTGILGNSDANKNYKFSYGAHTNLSNKISAQANANFENRYVRSHLSILGAKNNLAYATGLAGSFEIINGRFFFSRPVEQSITLIELPGQKNVQIMQNNGKILGKTNHNGHLLIPDLVPYEISRLNIDNKDLSLFSNTSAFNNDIELTPGFQTAHQVKFSSKIVRHLHFYLKLNTIKLPPGTALILDDEVEQSFVMNDGDVYLDVPHDKLVISGHDEFDKCRFKIYLTTKDPEAIIEEIGDIYCEQ
jgi:outer membrane usher protein